MDRNLQEWSESQRRADEQRRLQEWAEERREFDEQMGPPPSMHFPMTEVVGSLLVFAFRLGVFVALCALIYLIGRWVVGS